MIINENNKGKLTLMYYITMACNNRCPYCYVLDELDNKLLFNHKTFDEFKKHFNALDRTNPIELQLLGGDPLFVDEIQRIKELDLANVELIIFTNASYKPEKFKQRLNLLDGVDFNVYVSFHRSSNQDYLKENIEYLNDSGLLNVVSILLNDEISEELEPTIKDYSARNIKMVVSPLFEPNVIDSETYSNFNETTQSLFKYSTDENFVDFDGTSLNSYEANTINISEISQMFYLQCELNVLMVQYDGTVTSACSYNYSYHISKGILPKMVFCNNQVCYCDDTSYKKLLRPKKTEKTDFLLKFLKDKNELQ